ncbi:MAG: hypothetical protein WCO45_02625 [Pseudanabaena sp. ELA607]
MSHNTMGKGINLGIQTRQQASNAVVNLAAICSHLIGTVSEANPLDANSKLTIQRAAQSYVKSFLELCGTVGFMGSNIKADLLAAYVPMSFRLHQSVRTFDSIDAMELAFVRDQQRGNYGKHGNNLRGIELANAEQHLMILGEAGTGKSTFLKFIGMEALFHERGQYLPDCIPIYLDIGAFYHHKNQFDNPQRDLLDLIVRIFASHGFPSAEQLVRSGLKAGKFLLLINDLHIIPDGKRDFAHQLGTFTENYANNRFIASCRTASYRHSWGLFLEVAVEPWTSLYVQEFIYKWHLAKSAIEFNHDPDQAASWASEKAQQCWALVQHNLYPYYLNKTAIGCSALCLAFNLQHPLPHHPASLYQTIWRSLINNYIWQWQREYPTTPSKDNFRNESRHDDTSLTPFPSNPSQINLTHYGIMPPALMEMALAEMSYAIFEQGELFFTLQQAHRHMEQFLAARVSAEVSGLYAKETINFARKKYLWLSDGEHWYFAQPMLHEFFVARYVLSNFAIDRLVKLYLRDRRWHDVFLGVAALMPDTADHLLLSIERQTAMYLQAPKLRLILEWCDRIAHSADSAHTQTTKRIAAIFLTRTHELGLAPALTLSRAHLLAAALLKDLGLSLSLEEPFGIQLSLILARILEFDSSTELQLTRNLATAFERTLKPLGFANETVPFSLLSDQLAALELNIPNYEENYEIRHNFSQQIGYVWFDTLDIDRSLMTLNVNEVQSLEDYFYAHLLLRKCAHAAIAVSHRTMTNIEARLFSNYSGY